MKKLAVAILILTFCIPLFAGGTKETITVAMDPTQLPVLNPYTASDSDSVIIMQNLYEGLFEYDSKTSLPVGAIAKNYKISEDGLVWTFFLDPKARFSDGSRITAETFINSWNYLKKGTLSGNIGFIESTSSPDSHTLVVKLKNPVAYLPSLLCQPCLAAIKPDKTTAYSGPYVLKSFTEEKMVLSANKKYRAEISNDQVEIFFGEDFSQDFSDGKIQWSMAYVENAEDYIFTSPLYATTFFYFASATGPYSNPDVRKALVQAIPWNAIKAIQQGLLSTDSLVPESGAANTTKENYAYLMNKAGYTNSGTLPELKIGIHRGSQVYVIAELIAKLWSNYFGITVSIDTVPITVYTAKPEENPYNFCIVTWIADYLDPMAFLSLFDSSSEYNLANYSNSAFDSLLQDAANSDEITRTALMLQAEQILLDDCVVIPLSNALSTNFVRDDLIKGWYQNGLDIHPFKTLSLAD